MAIVNISGTINSSFTTSGVLANAAQAAGDAVFTIDLRPTNPIIIVQDNLDYGVLGWNINDVVATIILAGPEGEIYRNEDFNSPDIVPATSRYLNKTITLPLDPLTDYTNILKGNYTLKISWYNSVLDEYYNFLDTYQYDFDPPTIANTTVSGPYTGVLTSTDTTEYGNNVHQIIREHRIAYPDELPTPPADVVSSNAEVQVTPIYTNEWTITISSFVEYRNPDTLRIYWDGSGEFTHCVYGGCIGAMYDVIETMLLTYKEAMACNLNNQEFYQKRLVILNTAWHLLNEAYWSGDAEEADKQSYIIQEMVEYTGDGICGGVSSELVTPCPPWTGGGGGGTYTFSNGLTEGAGNVVWGGILEENTSILMVGYEVLFSGSDAGQTVSQSISASGGIVQKASDGSTEGQVEVTDSSVTLQVRDIGTPANTRGYEITATGLIEKGDYKAGYVDRQLVAKDYVDLLFAGAATYTFENGLTNTTGTVRLGGELTQATTIPVGTHSLTLAAADVDTATELYYDANRIRLTAHSGPVIDYLSPACQITAQSVAAGSTASMYVQDATGDYILFRVSSNFGTFLEDLLFEKGLAYEADYSTNGITDDRWIPDYGAVKAYADSVAGVTVFTGLGDTPTDYTGFGSYFVRVKPAEDGLEFVAAAFVPVTGGTFTGPITIQTSNDRPLTIRQVGAGSFPGTPEGGTNLISFQDNDGDEQGYVGIDASGNMVLRSWVTGGNVLIEDNLDVNGDITPTGDLYVDDIYERTGGHGISMHGEKVTLEDGMYLDQYGGAILAGSDFNDRSSRTDNVIKDFSFTIPHYDTDEEDVGVFSATSGTTSNFVAIGGNNTYNTLTEIRFNLADDQTTLSGTQVGTFTTAGLQLLNAAELDQYGEKILVGGDINDYTARTDSTFKDGHVAVPHYTNAEEPMLLIRGAVGPSSSAIYIGGDSSYNAPMNIRFYTAADTTTLLGTQIAFIDINGFYVDTIGELTAAAGVTINDEVYMPTIGGSGTGTSIVYYNRSTGELTYGDAPSGTSDVSVTNQGDNRVVTSTATTDVLNAEENVLYDGTSLTLLNGVFLDHYGDYLVLGSDFPSGGGRTDATAKLGAITFPHYTNSEENVVGLSVVVDGTNSRLYIGGGNTAKNAVTEIRLVTAANNTTLTGTLTALIDIDGLHVNAIGELTGAAGVTINDEVYLPGIGGTGTGTSILYYNRTTGEVTYADEGAGSMVYPAAGIAVSTGSAWDTSITDNSTNWNTAYSHSQVTSGNPHQVAWTELTGVRSGITLSGFDDDLTYGSSNVSVANQGDDRLITATGTTDALNAEQYATFDGSALTLLNGAELDQYGFSAIIGADTAGGFTSRTDAVAKGGMIAVPHYNTAEENTILIYGYNNSGGNAVNIGGGNGLGNAATGVGFFTAANTTTTSGTLTAFLDPTSLTLYNAAELDQYGVYIKVGSDAGSYTARTDATIKAGGVVVPHYTNAEEDVAVSLVSSTATTNVIFYGGGAADLNTVTRHAFYTAANNTTTTGTLTAEITPTNLTLYNAAELDQYGLTLKLGADLSDHLARTDNTAKNGLITGPHYDNDEEDILTIGHLVNDTSNQVFIGGGSALHNTATLISFWTAGDQTTTVGSRAGTFDSIGLNVNNISELNTDDGVTINDEVYLPGIGGTGTGTSIVYFNRTTGELTYGDAPTGTSDVSVNNQGDNRVVTSTATTDILNAEQYMTFDGSTLQLLNGAELDQVGFVAKIGADLPGFASRTDNTLKWGGIVFPHYSLSEEDVGGLYVSSGSTANLMLLGGGSALANTVTGINFYVAANNTTTTGTLTAEITPTNLTLYNAAELDQYGKKIKVGGDNNDWTTRTNSTVKTGALVGVHYTNAEEDVALIRYGSQISTSTLSLGGGDPALNAVTGIGLWVASDNTTLGGTLRAAVSNDGLEADVLLELTTDAGVTIRDEVYLPDITGTGTGTSIIYYNRTTGELTYADAPSGGGMVYPGAGIALSTGSGWDTSITDNSANWNTAYSHSQITTGNPHSIGYADITDFNTGVSTYETSHADVIVDGDFTANGLMRRTAAGVYDTITDSSSNWDTAYSHSQITTGNPHSIGYADISDFNTGVSTYETSHSDVVVDGDFGSNGILRRTAAGVYGSLTGSGSVDTVETTLTDDDTHIPTSGAVFAAIGAATVYTFDSGITEAGGNVDWGGTLSTDVTINGGNIYGITFGTYGSNQQIQYFNVSSEDDILIQAQFSVSSYGYLHISPYNDPEINLVCVFTDPKGFHIGADNFTVYDEQDLIGMVYNANYSAAGSSLDRWIPDWAAVKGYADTAASSYYTFDSGLTEVAGNVDLGGALTSSVAFSGTSRTFYVGTIGASSYVQSFGALSGTNSTLYSGGLTAIGWVNSVSGPPSTVKNIQFDVDAITVTDTEDSIGFQYADDYSTVGTTLDRWIPDWAAVKDYADGVANSAWTRTGTNLSPTNPGDDILLANTTERITFGDGDTYIFESAANSINITCNSGTALLVGALSIRPYLNVIPNATKTLELGSSSYYWNNAYVNRLYVDSASVYIDVDGTEMELTDSTGSYTLSDLAGGSGDVTASGTLTDNYLIVGNGTTSISVADATINFNAQNATNVGSLTLNNNRGIFPGSTPGSLGSPTFPWSYVVTNSLQAKQSIDTSAGGNLTVAGGDSAGGNGGNLYLKRGLALTAGTDGQIYFGTGSAGHLEAKGSETNVVYYNTTSGLLTYGTAGGGAWDVTSNVITPATSGDDIRLADTEHLEFGANTVWIQGSNTPGYIYFYGSSNRHLGIGAGGIWPYYSIIPSSGAGGDVNLGNAGYPFDDIFVDTIHITSINTTAGDYYLTYDSTTNEVRRGASTSDIRLKNYECVISSATQKVMALEGFLYSLNEQGQIETGLDGSMRAGLSAQDVQAVLPEAVRKLGQTDYLNIDYDGVVALLVNAVKEQQLEIEDLKSKLNIV